MKSTKENPIRPPTVVEWKGEERKLNDLCEDYAIKRHTVDGRLKRGWSLERAITEPVKQQTGGEVVPVDKRAYGVRTKILNTLMETFFKDPDRFEQWAKKEMDRDLGKFYEKYIMPFLPKSENALLDKGSQDKATIHIEFNAGEKAQPPTIIDYKP